MAKKSSPKADELLDLLNNDERIMETIMSRLEKTFMPTIERIIEKLATSLPAKLHAMIDQRIQKLTEEQGIITSALESENKLLRTKVDDLEVHMRLDNLVIYGLDVNSTIGNKSDQQTSTLQDPSQAVLRLFNDRLGLSISEQDLAKVHYLPAAKNQSRTPILVKFVSRCIRDSVLQARKQLKASSSPGANRVFINEHLTHHNAAIFSEARKLFKNKLIHSTWTREGRTYFKLSDSPTEKPRRATSLKDLALTHSILS